MVFSVTFLKITRGLGSLMISRCARAERFMSSAIRSGSVARGTGIETITRPTRSLRTRLPGSGAGWPRSVDLSGLRRPVRTSSSAGKTLFTRIASRSMFGFEKMVRSGQFTANRALGLRDRLGAIPLLIDDLTRDKFSTHVPDLVRTDQHVSGLYSPIVLTTNRDVGAISPDLTKRMVTCHIDGDPGESRGGRAHRAEGPARDRNSTLQSLPSATPPVEVRAMRATIDEEKEGFPDLLRSSSLILRTLLQVSLGSVPPWARPLSFDDYFGIRHRRFQDQLREMLEAADDRISVNRSGNELAISFGGDTNQAAQFAKSVPDFALKGRFADRVKLDLSALEQALGFTQPRSRWWKRLLGR